MQYAAILELLPAIAAGLIALTNKVVKGNEKYVLAIAAFFLLKKWTTEAARERALSDLQKGEGYFNPNALATLYRQAMNPSGYGWMMGIDGTDEALLFELAAKTQSYTAVYNAYYTAYKSNLTEDLKAELDTADYQRYLTILNR